MRNVFLISHFLLFFLPLAVMAQTCPSARHPRHAHNLLRQRSTYNLQPTTFNVQRAAAFVGDRRQLVVLASFSDLTFTEADPLVLWNRIFNEEHFEEAPFYGSVSDYFRDQSYGQFNLLFDLHAITVSQPHEVYRSTATEDSNAAQLIIDLMDVLRDEVDDWAPYDWDGDGYIDQLLVLYAGKGQNDGGGSTTIWAHQAAMSYYDLDPVVIASGDREYRLDNYGCFPELSGSGSYGTFGTLCHEYGHCLGLPDFYNGSTKYLYAWDIMDYGNYNMGGFCPPGYSAYERMFMNWLTPTELTAAATVTQMPALTDEPVAYLVRNDAHADEYYLIENRQPTGWDRSLPGSGVTIFHVDYDETAWYNNTPNTSSRKRYTIFAANNRPSARDGWAYPYADNDSLTDESVPAASLLNANSDGTRLMHKPVSHIQVTDGLASFDFMGGIPTAIRQVQTPTRSQVLYDLGPIYIIRYANGETKKVVKR